MKVEVILSRDDSTAYDKANKMAGLKTANNRAMLFSPGFQIALLRSPRVTRGTARWIHPATVASVKTAIANGRMCVKYKTTNPNPNVNIADLPRPWRRLTA